MAEALEGLAAVAGAQADGARALRLAAAAAAVREAIAIPLRPLEQAALDRWLAQAQRALSEAARTTAWAEGWAAEGWAMSPEQAVAYALDIGGSP
jgi:hypothetical protein